MKGQQSRSLFATRMGVIATTVGSAVGLGNIWRFPYEAGTHGGGAFILCYLFFIFLIGVPVICAEFSMGRSTHSGIFGAFRTLSGGNRWNPVAWSSILAAVMILSFYSVVAGWTLAYTVESAAGQLDVVARDTLHDRFGGFISGWSPLWWTLAFLSVNALVLVGGVRKGIERMSNVMMPVLFVILLVLCANSLMLPDAAEGLRFMFRPDFSAITPSVVLGALGQAFFSLSIGLGCMMTYASYFNDSTPIMRSAAVTALLDTLVALLAGIIIFPTVFSFGMQAEEGPRLVFEVLPSVFGRMPLGIVWSTLFFFLLVIASLTSTISMSEIFIAFLCDEFSMKRRRATLILTLLAMGLGSLCALSFGPLRQLSICGMTVFDIFDYVSSDIILPVGGMMISIFVGWRMNRAVLLGQLSPCRPFSRLMARWIVFSLRYIAPLCILLVLLSKLFSLA